MDGRKSEKTEIKAKGFLIRISNDSRPKFNVKVG